MKFDKDFFLITILIIRPFNNLPNQGAISNV